MENLYRGFEKVRKLYYRQYKKICNRCYSNKDVQLHHIIPVINGGTNNFNNLIPLCRNCHMDWHYHNYGNLKFKDFLATYANWEKLPFQDDFMLESLGIIDKESIYKKMQSLRNERKNCSF